jgi:hypothetical protein
MPYVFVSRFVRQSKALFGCASHNLCLRLLWNVASILILVLVYLGVLVSSSIVEFVPFNILQWFNLGPTDITYWIVLLSIIAIMLCLCGFILLIIMRRFSMRFIDVDAVVVLAGLIIAVGLGIWKLPTGL